MTCHHPCGIKTGLLDDYLDTARAAGLHEPVVGVTVVAERACQIVEEWELVELVATAEYRFGSIPHRQDCLFGCCAHVWMLRGKRVTYGVGNHLAFYDDRSFP